MEATKLKRTLEVPFAEARERMIEALKVEGFGILTEIDVAATMKKKLDLDYEPYAIMGACNPTLANRAISAAKDIGVFLPCNVAVYAEGDQTVVAVIDPSATIASVEGPPELAEIAADARGRLERALASL